jgi:methylglutaconyl-CoA hydratase
MATRPLTTYAMCGDAAWITLDSPASRNALSAELMHSLADHLDAAIAEPAARCIVLTGTGPAFCAGADLKDRGAALRGGDNPLVGLLRRIWDAPLPIIAAVNGHAFGGGLGLVAACDIAVAADTACFAFSEVRVGVIPATIAVVVIPKIGVHRAMHLFLTGERFDAEAAREYQILHRVVPEDSLRDAVQQEIDAIAQGGPCAVRHAKQLVRALYGLPMEAGFRHAEALIAEIFASAEAAEGAAAFAEKRPPRWVSRPRPDLR